MRNQLSFFSFFCCANAICAVTTGSAQATPQPPRTPTCAGDAPFVDASRLHSGEHIGIAGFPALEILPGSDDDYAGVVAREARISPNITYSCSYTSPIKKFEPSSTFLLSLYGYYSTPQWGKVKKVTFTLGGKTFSYKANYEVQGPGRDRSQDAQESNYFETLHIIIPVAEGRRLASNNGTVITTDPATVYLPVSASALNPWKQLVNSIDAISKNRKSQSGPQSPRPKVPVKSKKLPGTPIIEVFEEASGMTSLQTEISTISSNFGIRALASTAYQGKQLPQPFTAILVVAVSPDAIWTNVDAVTLSFGDKKLQLTPNARNSTTLDDGRVVESLSVRVPYRDFITLAKSPKFYVTVGEASFEVNSYQATGIRQLARRIAR